MFSHTCFNFYLFWSNHLIVYFAKSFSMSLYLIPIALKFNWTKGDKGVKGMGLRRDDSSREDITASQSSGQSDIKVSKPSIFPSLF